MVDIPSATSQLGARARTMPLDPPRDDLAGVAGAELEARAAAVAQFAADYPRHRDHVISKIRGAAVNFEPFGHSFIEQIFPDDLYAQIRAHKLRCKHGDELLDRKQDNPAFRNKRFNLADSAEPVVLQMRRLFEDPAIKLELLRLLYLNPSADLADALSIHGEFEYFFTQAGRFQNIHVDIPPKYLSFVFYIPDVPVSPEEEERNATVIYDKDLSPHYAARYRPNSVCVFAPHYYSYHGFASTIDRDVLVMFYVNREALADWRKWTKSMKDEAPFTGILDAIERKLRLHPLIEYGEDPERLLRERAECRINAPQGRILI